ncbi:Pacifastin-like protease inhibitor cvp4 [Papilio xuthus]|uniref:Pacifastin-like protease inhibitor cvp4 n=1 Tax=Papilio xuthus TaxID=66420 RepID=A0A194QFD2_PAPXU|nr:Pacifastin-like protease inhibitor cvp4 [Papilio xuthus]
MDVKETKISGIQSSNPDDSLESRNENIIDLCNAFWKERKNNLGLKGNSSIERPNAARRKRLASLSAGHASELAELPDLLETNPSVEVQCLAGTEWKSNCHSCRCLANGIAECSKEELCDTSITADPIPCKPHTVFSRDCSSCICLPNGKAQCTPGVCNRSNIPKRSELLSGKECSPGSKWSSQCNECHCNSEGYSSCTEMKCPGQENEATLRCAPDSVWMNECNTCWCTTDGRATCTRMGCMGSPAIDFNVKATEEPIITKDYEIEYILIDDPRNHLKRSVCKPNSEFQMDCNPCQCAADGQSFSCTRNECMEKDDDFINKDVEVFMKDEGVDHIEKHSEVVCKPRVIFHIGCNTCHCNFDGSDFSCTNKPCPLPKDVEIFHELKILRSKVNKENSTKAVICSANRMFIKDCNTCWCNEDGTSYFCTRKVCVLEVSDENAELSENARVIKQKCRPDEVFEMDCNMCRCNPDGQSYSCTRRACYPDDVPDDVQKSDSIAEKNDSISSRKRRAVQQEPPKACQPGQEFRIDCNKCLCNNEGHDFSCTRIDCALLNSNNNGGVRTKRETTEEISTNCSAGAAFQRACNVCLCGADGQRATCTTHDCDQVKTSDGLNAPESDPNFRCNPGEQFKRECNDCTCSADGKSVFCTLRYCSVYTP